VSELISYAYSSSLNNAAKAAGANYQDFLAALALPEPDAMSLLMSGLAMLGFMVYHRRIVHQDYAPT
jgi:hypothetical protein